jgi:Leucine-rich repeat (LRR) protein
MVAINKLTKEQLKAFKCYSYISITESRKNLSVLIKKHNINTGKLTYDELVVIIKEVDEKETIIEENLLEATSNLSDILSNVYDHILGSPVIEAIDDDLFKYIQNNTIHICRITYIEDLEYDLNYFNINCIGMTYLELMNTFLSFFNNMTPAEKKIYVLRGKSYIQYLDFKYCGLIEIPKGIPDHISRLYLSKNNITDIHPERLPKNLKDLYIDENKITFIPDLSHLTKLELICAKENPITTIITSNIPAECILELLNHYDRFNIEYIISNYHNLWRIRGYNFKPDCEIFSFGI